MFWPDKAYLLLGYGKSNRSLARYLETRGIKYAVYDDNLPEARTDVNIAEFGGVVKSGGIKNDHFLLEAARKAGVEIISDLELFYRLGKERTLITVTGTNGKTTTVNLIKHLLPDLDLAGNVGEPLFDFAESGKDMIIEASSFMLEYTYAFRSRISVLLNISPNHLDHHRNFPAYLEAKLRLLRNAKADDYLVYNDDDDTLRTAVKDYPLKKIPFSRKNKDGIYISDGGVFCFGKLVVSEEKLKLQGAHNLENIAAAVGAVFCYNTDYSAFAKLEEFATLPHRIEYLGRIGGTRVYNDAKATNNAALKASLEAFSGKRVLLIAGGKKREEDLSVLDGSLSCLDLVLANGENGEVLGEYFRKKGVKCLVFPDLDTLLGKIGEHICGQSVLLFSPGAVSYDQFRNFEERGDFFKEKIKDFLKD